MLSAGIVRLRLTELIRKLKAGVEPEEVPMTATEARELRGVIAWIRRAVYQPDQSLFKPKRIHDFIARHVIDSPGERIIVRDFRIRFLASLTQAEADCWSRKLICRQLRKRFTLRYWTANKLSIVDAAWRDDA